MAGHVFIPIQASQFDVWTLSRLVNTARGFNSVSGPSSVTKWAEAEEAIKDFEDLELAQSVIRDRIAYHKAARDGLCVAELRPEARAQEGVSCRFQSRCPR